MIFDRASPHYNCGEAATRTLNPEPNESKVKRGCEEMGIHFFTSPFLMVLFVVIQITNSKQLTTHDVGDRNDPMDAISEIYPFPI